MPGRGEPPSHHLRFTSAALAIYFISRLYFAGISIFDFFAEAPNMFMIWMFDSSLMGIFMG
jgi:hypothetical protein